MVIYSRQMVVVMVGVVVIMAMPDLERRKKMIRRRKYLAQKLNGYHPQGKRSPKSKYFFSHLSLFLDTPYRVRVQLLSHFFMLLLILSFIYFLVYFVSLSDLELLILSRS